MFRDEPRDRFARGRRVRLCSRRESVVSELGFGMFIEVSAEESEADATDMIEEDRSEL